MEVIIQQLSPHSNLQSLNQVGDVHGHLLNSSVVKRLNVSKNPFVFFSHEIDGYAFSAKPTSTANPERERLQRMSQR